MFTASLSGDIQSLPFENISSLLKIYTIINCIITYLFDSKYLITICPVQVKLVNEICLPHMI